MITVDWDMREAQTGVQASSKRPWWTTWLTHLGVGSHQIGKTSIERKLPWKQVTKGQQKQ